MSTEVTHPPGAILTRKVPKKDGNDELVVTGAGKKIVVTSTTEFGESFQLDPSEAFKDYDLRIPEGVVLPNHQKEYAGLSPEEQFKQSESAAIAARGETEKVKTGTRTRTKAQ